MHEARLNTFMRKVCRAPHLTVRWAARIQVNCHQVIWTALVRHYCYHICNCLSEAKIKGLLRKRQPKIFTFAIFSGPCNLHACSPWGRHTRDQLPSMFLDGLSLPFTTIRGSLQRQRASAAALPARLTTVESRSWPWTGFGKMSKRF